MLLRAEQSGKFIEQAETTRRGSQRGRATKFENHPARLLYHHDETSRRPRGFWDENLIKKITDQSSKINAEVKDPVVLVLWVSVANGELVAHSQGPR
jgi:hypothetical protein